jgi:hypothetical protein
MDQKSVLMYFAYDLKFGDLFSLTLKIWTESMCHLADQIFIKLESSVNTQYVNYM